MTEYVSPDEVEANEEWYSHAGNYYRDVTINNTRG